MSDNDLDNLIDRTVCEMANVEAPADMRARVLARIDTPAAMFPWVRIAAGTVLATLVIAALVLVTSRGPGVAPDPAPTGVARSSPALATPPPAAVPRRAPDTARHLEESGTRRVTAAVADVAAQERIAEIDPLAVIDPIAVSPLEHESFAPALISISPLAPIAEIQVEQLSPSGGRD